MKKELIWKARNADLRAYFESKGFMLKDESKGRYRVVGYGGLIIYGSFYKRFSTQESGNAVDCLVNVFGVDFKEAVEELTGIDTSKINYAAKANKRDSFEAPKLSKDVRRAIAYLIKYRKLDKGLIRSLMKHHLILQDDRGNVLFPYLNEKKEIVGAEIEGTYDQIRFKGILAFSDFNYPFMFQVNHHEDIYFFESAIDALSFYSLYHKQGLYVSLSGLKKMIFYSIAKKYPASNLYSCVDNDVFGIQFNSDLQSERMFCIYTPKLKDWNDDLKELNKE